HMGLFVYTKGSIISMVDLPTTEIIEPIFLDPSLFKCYYHFMGEKRDFIEKKTLKTGKLSRGNILMSLGLSILALVILFVTILCYQYTNT
ncbi:hypothetical protein P7H30_12065, partial [Streptococcus parauberis]|nr:hypothetical protein [Streptococcus parauberis]